MHLECILQSNLELQHPLLGLLRSFLPCSWPKGIKWFSDTKLKVALDFSHTSVCVCVWGRWFGCDSTGWMWQHLPVQNSALPQHLLWLLARSWSCPREWVIRYKQLALRGSLATGFKVLLVHICFHFTVAQPPWVSAVFVDLGEERPLTLLQTNFPSSCHFPTCSQNLCLPNSQRTFVPYTSASNLTSSTSSSPHYLPTNEGVKGNTFGVKHSATCYLSDMRQVLLFLWTSVS